MLKTFDNQGVYFGDAGAADYLKKMLCERGFKKILFVTGKESFSKSGAEQFLFKAGAEVQFRFSEFDPNPTCEDLLDGLRLFETVHPDCIVAAGGGSVMDMAKLINFFGVSKINPAEYLDEPTQSKPDADLLPCIAMPTTAGTGSEATHFSVLYKDHVKYSVADSRMVPDTVILCPSLTESMSSYQTACTGMDALAQGMESWWAIGATDESRKYAQKAVRLAGAYLERAVNNPDIEIRKKMQGAAYWAGRAINISKTTLCHALSYVLTSYYGYPHGHAVSVFLPEIYKVHLEVGVVPERLSSQFGGNDAVEKLRELSQTIGLGLKEPLGYADVHRVGSGVNSERLENNPLKVSPEQLIDIVGSSLSFSQGIKRPIRGRSN